MINNFDRFKILGFNSYTGGILEILSNGEIYTVKEIYEKTKIPKNKIYESLDFLKSKEIVNEEQTKPKRYFIVNFGIIDQMLEQKKQELEQLEENLEELKSKRTQINPSVLSIIEGSEELHNLIESSNNQIKEEIKSCSRLRKMHFGCFRTLKKAIERGVKVKFISLETKENFEILKAYHDIGVEIRIFTKKEIFPKIGLFDKKYARITIAEPDVKSPDHYKTIWANSSILYKIVNNHFEKVWEECKAFNPENS